jgi:hypothetical protein
MVTSWRHKSAPLNPADGKTNWLLTASTVNPELSFWTLGALVVSLVQAMKDSFRTSLVQLTPK